MTVAGLGTAGALLNSNEKIANDNGRSLASESSVNWADPLAFDATNMGAQSYSTGAAGAAPNAPDVSELQAIAPPASFDAVGSILISPELPSIEVADPARIAAARAESDGGDGAFRSGQFEPGSTLSASGGGRSAPYASASGGSFGGGGSGLGGAPRASADGAGQFSSGVANSTSGEGVHASGKRADNPSSSLAGGASSSASGLSSAPGLSVAPGVVTLPAQSLPVQSGLASSFVAGNSAGSAGTSTQTLQIAQVPEPSTVILLAAGLGFMARRRRRDGLTN